MAERPNVEDILAAARRGGAAKPADEAAPAVEPEAPAAEEVAAAPVAAKLAAAAPLGRPLTMKEKLAAARSGGAATPGAALATPAKVEASADEPAAAAAAAPVAAAKAPAPTPSDLGRPLTMKEKLAAARGGGAPAATAPAGAKPAAAKAGALVAAQPAAAARELPPLDKITDPRDLAEALRRAGADKDKQVKADAAAKAAEAAGATPGAAAVAAKVASAKKLETKAIPPKPSREGTSAAPGRAPARAIARRAFFRTYGWIIGGWLAFLVAGQGIALACFRFLYPNVLAEPPSTIKVGLASNFEPEAVNDRWKAEWGFWIVRSKAYDGEDKIYAIQSVCTHLGCPPNWLSAEAKFKCPCHGSGFYISGVNFEGPAPRPLERFKLSQNEKGELIVDKSQKFQEELKQWGDADSFIVA